MVKENKVFDKLTWVPAAERARLSGNKQCAKCGKEKPVFKFPVRTTNGKLYIGNGCSACNSSAGRARAKLKLYAAFGGRCSCCGEEHPYFLTLEHVNGGNPAKRRKVNGRSVVARIQPQLINEAEREGWDRAKYDLLCLNCNFAKGHFGECPHKSGVTKEAVMAKLRSDTRRMGVKYRATRGKAKSVEEVLQSNG